MDKSRFEALHSPEYVWRRILGWAAIGVVAALLLTLALYGLCTDGSGLFCKAVSAHPPWALISGVAAAPSLILLWRWRTTARGREAVQRDQEILSARLVNSVQMLQQDGVSAYAGVLALHQIAEDSQETYARLVVETLSTYIREKSPKHNEDNYSHEFGTYEWQVTGPVQAALTVLCSIETPAAFRVDLRSVDLLGADMTNLTLNGARLDDSVLSNVQASGVSLVGASLNGAWLQEADLTSATLDQADLRYALLQCALLDGATFKGALYNIQTSFPDDFDPDAMGMVRAGS